MQGAALPHETGGHDVDDVLGFSRLFWASTVPPLCDWVRAESTTFLWAVGDGDGNGRSPPKPDTGHSNILVKAVKPA